MQNQMTKRRENMMGQAGLSVGLKQSVLSLFLFKHSSPQPSMYPLHHPLPLIMMIKLMMTQQVLKQRNSILQGCWGNQQVAARSPNDIGRPNNTGRSTSRGVSIRRYGRCVNQTDVPQRLHYVNISTIYAAASIWQK